ncbi:MAG: putative adhesin [Burkholderiales bacterium]
MVVTEKNGFRISRSGLATQLVINCHGGWIEKDGYTTVPAGTKIFFYAPHQDYTLGYRVLGTIEADPKQAKVGLKKTVPPSKKNELLLKATGEARAKLPNYLDGLKIPQTDLDPVINAPDENALSVAVATLRRSHKIPAYMDPAQINIYSVYKLLKKRFLDNTCGIQASYLGGWEIFNYRLFAEPDAERKKFDDENFQRHRKGEIDPDVDLVQLWQDKKRHLSDVFDLVANDGYKVVHYGACRVSY